MPRRPAAITQADVARAIRAAKQEGWRAVRLVLPSGATIELNDSPQVPQAPAPAPVEPKKVVVL